MPLFHIFLAQIMHLCCPTDPASDLKQPKIYGGLARIPGLVSLRHDTLLGRNKLGRVVRVSDVGFQLTKQLRRKAREIGSCRD